LSGRRWVGSFAAALLFATVTAPAAAAEPSEGEKKAAAQALFDEGRQLTLAGKFADACPKFVESKRLDPAAMGTTFYLADCFEHIGKLASAWTYYLEAADLARAGAQADREKAANDRADAIKPRLARLAIKVSPAVRAIPGLSITRDGVGVGEAQWGIGIPIDLGAHLITVIATDRRPAEVKIETTREGTLVEVPVPLPEPLAPPPPTTLPPPEEIVAPPSPAPRIAGFVVGGAGIVGVALSAVFGAQAISKKNESNENGHCDSSDACDPTGRMLRSEGIKAATASTVSIVLGGLALGTGIVLLATAPRGEPLPAAVPSVAIGPGAASLAWRW
jgi:hypothetical protein